MSQGPRKTLLWVIWLALTSGLIGYFCYELLVTEQKSDFLIGEATHGHHQIEMVCSNCHTDPFGGKELIHDACLNCHKAELDEANDSHPIKKFTDPRNADRVAILDARNCVTCHNEHQLEQTRDMGVTLPSDFCFNCHQDIGEDRRSHQGMAFDSCASAGCHNFHDNMALYEDFLLQHQNEQTIDWKARILPTNLPQQLPKKPSLTIDQADKAEANTVITGQWAHSDHAQTGVNCTDCHQANNTPWQARHAPGCRLNAHDAWAGPFALPFRCQR